MLGASINTNISNSSVGWNIAGDYDRLALTVQGPDGTVFTKEFRGAGASLNLSDFAGTPLDGLYHYDLRAVPRISPTTLHKLAAARLADDDATIERIRHEAGLDREVVQSGVFTVLNGRILTPVNETGGSVNATARSPQADDGSTPTAPTGGTYNVMAAPKLAPKVSDQVIPDDLIVQGSACVGLDCVNNESFGFDTIRMKENNTRIKFDDTSTSAGFPNNDWQLTANDSASGGANKFSIDDITGSKTPFTITAGAPTNSLFVASNGKIGNGNSAPGLNFHITSTDTPAIRQEQTSGGGFTAQTWDIGANEANWFVRDVTGGSRLPLRIRPGAPTSSIDISASGNVGIGTASPQVRLDVRGTDPTLDIFEAIGVDPTSGPSFNLGYSGASFGRGSGFINVRPDASAVAPNPSIRFLIANNQRMILDNEGFLGLGVANPGSPIEHSSGAVLTAGGTWQNASSIETKRDICDLSSGEAASALRGLNPVKFTYKIDPKEKHVGFIAEDVPDLVASPDRKSLSPMDIVAVLTQVVKDQQKTIEDLTKRLDQLEKKN
jgi:hypothetical protein